jgi:hypothetical protein
MKAILFILAIFTFLNFQLFAQNTHIGTWKLLTAKYISSSGETDFFNNYTVKETKIITPTHFMWMIQIPDSLDESKKNYRLPGAGTYTINGDNYVEVLEYASWEGYARDKTNFTLQIDKNIMVQTGNITYPDGSSLTLEETWQRQNLPPQEGKHVGTWHMTSQKVTNPKGKTTKTDMATIKQVKIISPTHWMFVAENIENGNKKFRGAAGGTYSLNGTRYIELLENAEDIQTDYVLQVKGNKLFMQGSLINPQGEKFIYDEVYQREVNNSRKFIKTGR